jgi:hypothetical protein
VEPFAAACSLTSVGPVVVVLAAYAGAGASTVAVLLGDAATATGARTRLIECADPGRSGVAGATDTELGEDRCGWRLGRRGLMELDRPAAAAGRLADVAQPRPVTHGATGESLTVIDAGWPAWDVLASSSWVTGLLETARLLLVCRVTVPGIRQTEVLLAALSGRDPVIAALGPTRWPGVVTASCGPLLRAARDSGRVVPVPIDRHLAVTGLTAGPLPKQLFPAGRALAGRVLDDFPVLSRAG